MGLEEILEKLQPIIS